jgi:membrane protein YdbS with pleckstrin-like domain
MASTNTSPLNTASPVISVNTADLAPAVPQSLQPATAEAPKNGQSQPNSKPSLPGTEAESPQTEAQSQDQGVGVEGEEVIWEARYSKRNFIGRIAVRSLVTIAALALAAYTWGAGHPDWAVITWIMLGGVTLAWLALAYRMFQAHYSHYYRLTNRRLFVATGVFSRRRDMMELLTVKDVFTRQQSLLERWLGLGTVVVVPNEKDMPTFYLAGVDDPKEVMDLVWHHARVEREGRAVEVNSI